MSGSARPAASPGEEHPTAGDVPAGPHGDGRPADPTHARLAESDGVEVAGELVSEPAPRRAAREDADAHREMVRLGEDPAVAAGRSAEIEPGAVGEAREDAGRHLHLGVEGGHRGQRLGPARRAGGRARGAVGRDQEPGTEGPAARLELDVIRREPDALQGARGLEHRARGTRGLGEREVERRAHGHVDERRLSLDGDGDARVREARFDPPEAPLDGNPDTGRQRFERPRHDPAPARLVPGKPSPIEEGNLDSRPREYERRRGTRRPRAHDRDVHRSPAGWRPAGRGHRRGGRQRPFHSARRFSRNARTPSWKSSLR